MARTRYAQLFGRGRKVHLCPDIASLDWRAVCGLKGWWVMSYRLPPRMFSSVCKNCLKKEAV